MIVTSEKLEVNCLSINLNSKSPFVSGDTIVKIMKSGYNITMELKITINMHGIRFHGKV